MTIHNNIYFFATYYKREEPLMKINSIFSSCILFFFFLISFSSLTLFYNNFKIISLYLALYKEYKIKLNKMNFFKKYVKIIH